VFDGPPHDSDRAHGSARRARQLSSSAAAPVSGTGSTASGRCPCNDPVLRPASEAQGEYFRAYADAGFVADPAELLAVHRRLDACALEAVALFHVHRRQPANFSVIDFRLHNPAYRWHLIISLRDPARPVLRPFAVRKDLTADFGISAEDHQEGSEQSYVGPEVSPLDLVVDTTDDVVGAVRPRARARV
jgi:hypothetical protein